MPAVRRGRPPKSTAETEIIKDQIRAAAREVYVRAGYHGTTVEDILKKSGVSRATFYRHFDSVHAIVDDIVSATNRHLLPNIITAVLSRTDPLGRLEAGVNAWLDCCEATGPMLQPMFREFQDPASPAQMHRQRILDETMTYLAQLCVLMNRPPWSRLQVESFVMGAEFVGYNMGRHSDTSLNVSREEARQAMIRLAIGLLGSRAEWAHATQVAHVLGIELD